MIGSVGRLKKSLRPKPFLQSLHTSVEPAHLRDRAPCDLLRPHSPLSFTTSARETNTDEVSLSFWQPRASVSMKITLGTALSASVTRDIWFRVHFTSNASTKQHTILGKGISQRFCRHALNQDIRGRAYLFPESSLRHCRSRVLIGVSFDVIGSSGGRLGGGMGFGSWPVILPLANSTARPLGPGFLSSQQ